MPPATGQVVSVPLPAELVLEQLSNAGATHVVTVPDTHLRTVMAALDAQEAIQVVRAATEDDVLGICAGLWMAGRRPVALIQQLGVFASVNSLRGLTYDMGIPLAVLAGLYGRDPGLAVDQSPRSSVRLCRPVLDALGLRHVTIERTEDAGLVGSTLGATLDGGATSVVLIGAPTR